MRPRSRRLDGPRPGALRKGKLRNALAHCGSRARRSYVPRLSSPGLALPASPATGDNSTAIATTAFFQAAIAGLGGSLPTSCPQRLEPFG